MDKEKKLILKNALPLIAESGWNDKTLTEAVVKSGFDKDYDKIYFPTGYKDLLLFYFNYLDNQLEKSAKYRDDEAKTGNFIKELLFKRLDLMAKNHLATRKAYLELLKPENLILLKKINWKTADLMWCLSNDKSTDFNYYTKRLTLASIYGAAILYWINDKSDNFEATKKFIERRISNVVAFAKFKSKIKAKLGFTHQ